MNVPILATKLYVPRPRSNVILRPHLIARLNEGLHVKLTLISAPAGFGKTTLVSEWLASCECAATWVSLDDGDNDPNRFLTYLVAALRTIVPTIGEAALSALQPSQPTATDSMLTALLNELSTISHDVVIVLDDYHVIEAPPIDTALTFLLEHLPPQMHLLITTREDPQLPLARLRARGQLMELRAADLRFSLPEADQFLNHIMRLGLSDADIATLESRTEGWIAGLQLAALSVQGNHDVAEFIRAFAGDHRYIMDYLVEEVLERQSEAVRNFLLQTAILDRLSGSLCDAVTGLVESKARLEELERGNFFVVPLDDKRQWYRYHHLFAQVLYTRLMTEQPDHVSTLHQRASAWYEQNGLMADAIRHALAAEDFERAAGLIERAAPIMYRNRQEATVLGWFQALPDDLFRNRPVLSIQYVGTLLTSGKLEGVEDHLLDAEKWLDTIGAGGRTDATAAEMVVMDDEELRALPGSIAMYRAGLALALGKVADTVQYARRVLDLVPEHDYLRRGAASALVGLAYWTMGNLATAHRSYGDGMTSLQRAGNISDAVGGTIALADILITQGRLHDAMRSYERGLQLASEHGAPEMRGTADMLVGMSELYLEYDDVDSATKMLLRSKAQGEHTGFPQNPYRWRVAMARVYEAQADPDAALDLLEEAERLYVSDMYPNVRPVLAMKTRVWITQGRLREALDWVREHNLSVEDDLSYLREYEHITLVRLLLAHYRSDHGNRLLRDATRLLERLLSAADNGGRTGRVIEILILQALARQMHGDSRAAIVPLERALTLAEPESYVRLFVDEGAPMAVLLEEAAKHKIAPTYVRQLLSAFRKDKDRAPASQGLTEPLSERELEVLRLLGTDLKGPEIARELIVSLSTLRTHTQNIYTKLGVNNRRAAIRRAEELDLF